MRDNQAFFVNTLHRRGGISTMFYRAPEVTTFKLAAPLWKRRIEISRVELMKLDSLEETQPYRELYSNIINEWIRHAPPGSYCLRLIQQVTSI